MKLHILSFGALTDILTPAGFDFATDTISTVQDLHQHLATTYPAITQQKFRYAVNQELVDDTHPLQDGDEIALLPPFSGG
jgi:molybdopterin converting factor small subunit